MSGLFGGLPSQPFAVLGSRWAERHVHR